MISVRSGESGLHKQLQARGSPTILQLLKRTWEGLKAVMAADGVLDPLVREMISIAVSTANGCSYCVHSHTAAAKARGMTKAQHAELLAVMRLGGTNQPFGDRDARFPSTLNFWSDAAFNRVETSRRQCCATNGFQPQDRRLRRC